MAIIKQKTTIVKEVEIYIAPCVKCGIDKIKIGDCGYNTFNVAYAECKCGNKWSSSCGDSPDLKWIAGEWNKLNDIVTLIKNKESQISNLKTEIVKLKKLQKERK